jgi:hypothetical protein
VFSVRRKHSGNGRKSRILGRNFGGVHLQVQENFQSESPVSENEGGIKWQQPNRKIKNTGKEISE